MKCSPAPLWHLLALFAGLLSCAVFAASASADNFDWSAAGPPTPTTWSTASNWIGNVAPSSGSPIDLLVFPQQTSSACVAAGDACYNSHNDVSGLTVNALQLDDNDGYILTGNALTLGAGGLMTVAGGNRSPGYPVGIDMPIMLGAGQTWTMDADDNVSISLADPLSGQSYGLAVVMGRGADLYLSGDNEIGDVTPDGVDQTLSGPLANGNGTLNLINSKLDASDGHTVTLRHVALFADNASVGALDSNASRVWVGQGQVPTGSLSTVGATFDETSWVQFAIASAGTTAGSAYSQMTSTGNIDLGGASLSIEDFDGGGGCAGPPVGQVETIISTSDALSGQFANMPDGAVVAGMCTHNSGPQAGLPYTYYRINYTATSVTATVGAGPGGPAPPPPPCEGPAVAGNLLVQGIEVSQGVQTIAFPDTGEGCSRSPLDSRSHLGALYPSGPSWRDPAPSPPRTDRARYVELVQGRTMVVRVFAAAHGGSSVAPVAARLYVFRDGRRITPTPLAPVAGRRTLSPGVPFDIPYYTERIAPDGAYEFDLPGSWAHGTLTLVAQLNPPNDRPAVPECPGCAVDDVFTLSQIKFTKTRAVRIHPVSLTPGGLPFAGFPSPLKVFADAALVLPVADGQLIVPPVYEASMSLDTLTMQGTSLAQAIYNWCCANAGWPTITPDPIDDYVGVICQTNPPDMPPPCPSGKLAGETGNDGTPISVVNATRPLTSVSA